jgi:AcrR family transcriptional regulator
MARVVKPPEVRRAEILEAAARLFVRQGYAETAVDAIVREANVAKGTFYYYFRSKEDILDTLSVQMVSQMCALAKSIAVQSDLPPIQRLAHIFTLLRQEEEHGQAVVGGLHRPENRELHQRNNAAFVTMLGPILAEVVEDGIQKGIFDVVDPLSTIQFLLAGSLMMFGEGAFNWSAEERQARSAAMIRLSERALGCRENTLQVLLP